MVAWSVVEAHPRHRSWTGSDTTSATATFLASHTAATWTVPHSSTTEQRYGGLQLPVVCAPVDLHPYLSFFVSAAALAAASNVSLPSRKYHHTYHFAPGAGCRPDVYGA